ncbi:unnamed protein product, partial [Discosporangium mesarthrocarpum]
LEAQTPETEVTDNYIVTKDKKSLKRKRVSETVEAIKDCIPRDSISGARQRPRGFSQKSADIAQGTTLGNFHHPFPTEYGDHFETPLQAYRDVEGILSLLAKRLGRQRKTLRIWDPYFCAGRTPRLLGELGFPSVFHQNEDFYKVIREGRQPKYDVLITNPPYSGDHKRLCLEYCVSSGKPWLLLIPNYVATKDYYREAAIRSDCRTRVGGGDPFYVVPTTRYMFDHPEGTGHASSPFMGVWFVHAGEYTEGLFSAAAAQKKAGIRVVRSVEELGSRGVVNTQKRLNPRQRKAAAKRRG